MRTARKSKQLVAAVAGFAIAAVGLLSTTAEATLPVNTIPNGAATIAPASGTRTTLWGMTLPGGAACPGDTNSGDYLWSAFLASNSVDTSQLTWPGGSPTYAADPAAIVQPLFSSGTPIVSQNTAAVTGAVLVAGTQFDLSVYPANFIPAGQYKVGVACVKGTFAPGVFNTTEAFWQTTINIAVNGAGDITNYSPFTVPPPPTLASPLTVGNGSLAGTFTAPAATPAATGFTVTAVPASGPAVPALNLPAGSTSFTLTGLANGISHSVTVTQTNNAGSSAASNAVAGTPADPNQRPAVTNLVATPGSGNVVLTWTAPTGVAPTGYNVAVSPTVSGAPFTIAAGVLTATVSGTPGTLYTFTVTPNHVAPFFGSAAIISATPVSAQSIIQNISVVRPQGALVLTQVCGVYGPLNLEPASTGFPELAVKTTTTFAAGGPTAPTLGANGTGGVDTNYTNGLYPSPAFPAYPTYCGISLGTATLVTTGAEAGQYYAANGQINQVTVSDTRDGQNGWNLGAVMSDFTQSANNSITFPGSSLGWTPKVNGFTIGQVVTAGARVLPLTTPGLKSSGASASSLASATTASLGIAQMDARLRLLIPVAIPSGTYNATLTFSFI